MCRHAPKPKLLVSGYWFCYDFDDIGVVVCIDGIGFGFLILQKNSFEKQIQLLPCKLHYNLGACIVFMDLKRKEALDGDKSNKVKNDMNENYCFSSHAEGK